MSSTVTTSSVDELLTSFHDSEELLLHVQEQCPDKEQEVIAALKRRLAWSCKEGAALSKHMRFINEQHSSRVKRKAFVEAGLTLIKANIMIFVDDKYYSASVVSAGIDLNGPYLCVKYKSDGSVDPRLYMNKCMWKFEEDDDETETESESSTIFFKKRKRKSIESESETENERDASRPDDNEDNDSRSSSSCTTSNSSTITSDSNIQSRMMSTEDVMIAWLGSYDPNCSPFLSVVGGKAFRLASSRWESVIHSSAFMKETLLMICRGVNGIENVDNVWCKGECIVCKRSRTCRKVLIKDVFSEPVLVGKTCLDRLNSSREMFHAWQQLAINPTVLPKTEVELNALKKTASKLSQNFNKSLCDVDVSLGMDKRYHRHPTQGWGYY